MLKFIKKYILVFLLFFLIISGINAQSEESNWDFSYWMLNGGIGMSDILVDGLSFGFIIEPKIPLTSSLMLGSKNAINFSTDGIIALETQVFLRWNFLTFNLFDRDINAFIQGGLGFLGAIKGPYNRFDPRDTRSSLLADFTAGITIPLTSSLNIEPSVRFGYPFIFGLSVTAGYKFPLPQKTEYIERPGAAAATANEIIRRIIITQVEYILFGGDIYRYNEGIDADARSLNDLVLNQVSQILRENRDLHVRIEGHANPVTREPAEIQELAVLSERRANEVARLLRARGVRDEQIVLIALGGTRTIASDHAHWNMNRRVELIIIQMDTE